MTNQKIAAQVAGTGTASKSTSTSNSRNSTPPIVTGQCAEVLGLIRRNAALYSIGSPEWPRPGFFENEEVSE